MLISFLTFRKYTPGLKSGACNPIVKLPGLKAGVSIRPETPHFSAGSFTNFFKPRTLVRGMAL